MKYHVEREGYHVLHNGPWWFYLVEGTRDFCLGYVTAMDDCYPSTPFRVVATYPDRSDEILWQTTGCPAPASLEC